MNNDVSEIKNRLNIVDVLGEYIRLEKAGANFRAVCPFHNEKSPSFMVSEERQMWHCFGCQKSGDVFSFVMEMDGLDFREALKILAEKAGVKLSDYNPEAAKKKDRTLEILELATKWYEYQLHSGPGKTNIINYLRERGLMDETITTFRLGYAPKGWRNMLNFLNKRGFQNEEILQTGLIVKKEGAAEYYDRFRERIMFPIQDYMGHVVGYSARVEPGGDETQAKYVNTPETQVYHKSKILYGIYRAKEEIKKRNFTLLVEGNLDVIAAHQAGLRNAVAVSGTALTNDQIVIIKRYAPKIKMFFDMDAAGEAATKKSVKLCLENDVAVEVVTLPAGKDAADAARENPADLLRAVDESKGIMEYFLQKLYVKFDRQKVEDKRKIAEECLDILVSFENAVEKSHWIKKLAEDLKIAETALTEMLKKISLKGRVGHENTTGEGSAVIALKHKSEILEEELIGLMLVFKDVWKEAKKRDDAIFSFSKDSLLNNMLTRALEVDFDFDKLITLTEDLDQKKRAENIFFQKKYRIDLNNNLEEILLNNPLEELEACLYEMKKEAIRKDLVRLAGDLKMAEEKKDKEAIVFLRQEFNNLSKEVSNQTSVE